MKHGENKGDKIINKLGPEMYYQDSTGRTFSRPLESTITPQRKLWCSNCMDWKRVYGTVALLFGCPDCKKRWNDKS